MQLTVFSWLNLRSRSALLSDLYSLVQSVPVALTVIRVLLNPFGKGFKVTPKGLSRDKFSFNWTLAFPMAVLLFATCITFSISLLSTPAEGRIINIGLWLSGYNLVTMSAALITLLDVPTPSFYEWFANNQPVKIVSGNNSHWGITQKISEEGMEIFLQQSVDLTTKVNLELVAEELTLSGCITRTYVQGHSLRAIVKFHNLSLEQHRKLVHMLYCRPGTWQKRKTPGELQSLLILFKVLLRPIRFLNPKNVSQLEVQY